MYSTCKFYSNFLNKFQIQRIWQQTESHLGGLITRLVQQFYNKLYMYSEYRLNIVVEKIKKNRQSHIIK